MDNCSRCGKEGKCGKSLVRQKDGRILCRVRSQCHELKALRRKLATLGQGKLPLGV